MLEFHPATEEDLLAAKPYFAAQNLHISDFSVGFQFMWMRYLKPAFAYTDGCLIIREKFAGKDYFHYPISLKCGEGEEAAIEKIEAYCRESGVRMHFTNVPRSRLAALVLRYGREVTVTDVRRWRDYLYRAEDFKEYAGGKYAGQRNHVHKFTKNYAWEFRVYGKEDEALVLSFLHEYEAAQRAKGAYLAEEEMDEVFRILPEIGRLGLFGGILFADGRPAAVSFGERCGDTVVVHIEKALREFEGAYPMIAQQFARAFCGDGVRFLNRMDDAGDRGLRKSKLQYLPCELVDKYNVLPKRAIDAAREIPEIQTERLTIGPLRNEDAEEYARLASDVERNKWWGYDWREDCKGKPRKGYFLKFARECFRTREEMPAGIYADGKLVGEVVLHRFGYRDEAEIGVRLLPEAEGNGYAREALSAMADYAFMTLGVERLEAKCFRENERSRRTLLSSGMHPCGEDETYFYFTKTAAG